MKNILLIVTTLFSIFTFAQVDPIISIPSANFKAKLLAASSSNQIASTETPVYDELNGVWTVTSYHKIDTNNDNQIQLSEALAIKWLNVNNSIIQNFEGILSFTNLQYLDCSRNASTSINLQGLTNLKALNCIESIKVNNIHLLTNLNLQGLSNLETLNCSFNKLSSINIQDLTNLKYFNCNANAILTLNFNNLVNLKYINCNNNQLTSLSIQGMLNLTRLECYYNQLLTLDIQGLNSLNTLLCSNNQLPSLNVQGLINLIELNCSYNQLSSLNVQGLTNLQTLVCTNLQLTNLYIQNLNNLRTFYCEHNLLTTLNLQGLNNLETLICSNNLLTGLDLQVLSNNFKYLTCRNNQLTSLNVQSLNGLVSIECENNQLTILNVQGLNNFQDLYCSNNQLTSLNLQGSTNFSQLYCQNNQLSTLDLTGLKMSKLNCSFNQILTLNLESSIYLQDLYCQNNLLTTLFIKNGINEQNINFSNNTNLHYICCDDAQISNIQQQVVQNNQANCTVNSYCSFTPGGNYNTISGNLRYNFNNSTCTNLINSSNFIKFSNVSNNEQVTINNQGQYVKYIGVGTYTLTPQIENSIFFNVNPSNSQVIFSNNNYNAQTQNFCITPNGIHHDVEVTLIPITPARPGFDATYKIIYKNKGTQVENGTVIFSMYNPNVVDFVSCSPTYNSQTTNASLETFTWNYSNLQPFETREINIVTNLNSPMETPPLNAGAFLSYDAQILINNSDENTFDNFSGIRQIVVNSYDPNDKTCIEGATITPSMVGKYVHYVIRFENTGTYPAENVVIKDMIDLAKFDIATLIPIRGSHNFETRIAGNKVEFIFENINLPFDDANNDGYVAFKIKTKPTLVLGDTFSNLANIYFDYNFPIITNTATTTVAALSSTDFDFGTHFTLYPNPVKDVLNFQSKEGISIHSIEIYTTLGQVVLAVTDTLSSVDVSSLQAGNYIVKVHTDLGVSNTKFIKE